MEMVHPAYILWGSFRIHLQRSCLGYYAVLRVNVGIVFVDTLCYNNGILHSPCMVILIQYWTLHMVCLSDCKLRNFNKAIIHSPLR